MAKTLNRVANNTFKYHDINRTTKINYCILVV